LRWEHGIRLEGIFEADKAQGAALLRALSHAACALLYAFLSCFRTECVWAQFDLPRFVYSYAAFPPKGKFFMPRMSVQKEITAP
jgi:hypothetical protein